MGIIFRDIVQRPCLSDGVPNLSGQRHPLPLYYLHCQTGYQGVVWGSRGRKGNSRLAMCMVGREKIKEKNDKDKDKESLHGRLLSYGGINQW